MPTYFLFDYFYVLTLFIVLFIFLFFFGRAFIILYSYVSRNKFSDNFTLINTKASVFYPIFGLFFLGNCLIIFNYFLPIKSFYVYLFTFIILLINLNEKIDIKIIFSNISIKFLISLILVISTFDINFHYDGGYYHIGHQFWIRESKLVVGFVNIFWAYGIGSIYEFISAFFWIGKNFYVLHLLNLIFLFIFFEFIYLHIINLKFSILKIPFLFLILFSIFDNFGYQGGRNGYLYIEGISAFDNPVAIVFFITALVYFILLNQDNIQANEIFLVTSLTLFLIQLKLSSVVILVYLVFLTLRLLKNGKTIIQLLQINLLNAIFFFSWIIKNLLTSGCLIFPVSITCNFNFRWYIKGSTLDYQNITTTYSNSYKIGENFYLWTKNYLEIPINKTVLYNLLVSILIFLVIRVIFFKKNYNLNSKYLKYFIFINITYYIFTGPTPRYYIGLVLIIISYLGMNLEFRYKKLFSNNFLIFLFFISVLSLPRINSYKSLYLNNIEISIPKVETEKIDDTWVTPVPGEDQCWNIQFCTPEKRSQKIIINEKIYKTVYLNN